MNIEALKNSKSIGAVSSLLIVGSIGYGAYFGYTTYQELQETKQALNLTIQTSQGIISTLEEKNQNLSDENENITSFLTVEQKKNIDLERQQERNDRKIDTLEKLTTLDPELLKKYSKVFFLSENYTPPKLRSVDNKFKIDLNKDIQVLREVEPFLDNLLKDADDDGVNLRVISSYRSFETQQSLKSTYLVSYGTGANQFSADQGYSEHQLGTTVDFGTPEVQGTYLSFEKTLGFDWLTRNAHRYGFVLSYPKGNSFYQYEPWHWRFVGTELATDLHDDDQYFYELDQRTIDKYLLEIFD